jgi:hypothetical protein
LADGGARESARTLAPMKTLFKLALIGAFTAVLVKWAREWSKDGVPTLNPLENWQPDAASPLRGEDLQVEQQARH